MTDILPNVLEKMRSYNASPTDDILLRLIEGFYLPHVKRYEENYKRNLLLLPDSLQADFPPFSSLPIYLFKVTDAKSFIFDVKNNQFIIDEKESYILRLLRLFLEKEEVAREELLYFTKAILEEKEFYHLKTILREKIAKKSFDHEYLNGVKKLATLHPSEIDLGYLNALYLLDKGQKEEAYNAALVSYEKRQSNVALLSLMIKLATLNKKYTDAAYYMGLYLKKKDSLSQKEVLAILEKGVSKEIISDAIGLGFTEPAVPPIRINIALTRKKNTHDGIHINIAMIPYMGRKLVESYERSYIAGIYTQNDLHCIDGEHLDICIKGGVPRGIPDYKNFHFDLIYAEKKKSCYIKKPATPIILPLASTEARQEVEFDDGTSKRKHSLGKYEYEFFRINEDVKISSDYDLIIGEPIKTGHSKKRKKLVLNLMLDALSWRALRKGRLDYIPNIMKFFQKGIIFDNNYSVAEYTYPSVATVESGMYMHKSQVIANICNARLSKKYITLGEQMKKLGYFTANVASDGQGVINGAYRGYDRIILNYYSILSANCVDRTLLHLDAFSDLDAFYYVHFFDTHCNKSDIASELFAQTTVNLSDRIVDERDNVSVHARPTLFNQTMNLYRTKMTDLYLGLLFDYIEKHFTEDEYIVTLYSDHGSSIFTPREEHYLLSDEQVGAALMMRGAGVPSLGILRDELTSPLDIYKILGKLTGFPSDMDYLDGNLPEVFGGKKREYTISNSIFPGQTSKFCVRTLDYECRLETKAFTSLDFTADLSDYKLEIFTRDQKHRPVYSDKLRQYFLEIIENYVNDMRNDRSILTSP